MAPAKKKSKPNDCDRPNDTPVAAETKPPKVSHGPSDEPADSSSKARPNSWYNGGSWRSKASPVAQVAHESVSVDHGTTSEASAEAALRPSQSVIKGMKGSRKSVPLIAEPTMVNATGEPGDKARSQFPPHTKEETKPTEEVKENGDNDQKVPDIVLEDAPLPPETGTSNNEDAKSDTARQSGKWFAWWSRPDGYSTDGEKSKETTTKHALDAEEATKTPLPGTPVISPDTQDQAKVVPNGQPTESTVVIAEDSSTQPVVENTPTEPSSSNNRYSKSWFGRWSSTQNQQANEETVKESEPEPSTTTSVPVTAEETSLEADSVKIVSKKKETEELPKPSGWAFWSTDKAKDLPQTPSGTQRQIGELAVADTPSQSHPEAAQFNQQPQPKTSSKSAGKGNDSDPKPKRGRIETVKDAESSKRSNSAPSKSSVDVSAASQPLTVENRVEENSTTPVPVQRGKQHRPNLILPAFEEVFSPLHTQSYLERLAQYLAQTLRIPGSLPPPPPKHVNISTTLPKIRKAIAIGVHGFFPAPLLQKVLGQPTGTSIRFANYAAASIKTWCHEKQPEIKEVEIEKVALEGEGFIADRVNTLWKLLLNWLSHLRQADFILVACHSQGVPVALTLVSKLIQLGCLSPNVRIGVCAMAGINMGPFPEYKSRLFGGTALELFDFCDSNSKVSRTYAESLDVCLRHGVRLTFVGSIDDQLVSLESSLHASLSHPYVARAVFIDGRLHAPNFLTHLVVFALRLRNLGISDHGLIRELSGPLAGSLVGGEGHSRLYDDPAVYNLAIAFALESTDMPPSSAAAIAATIASSTASGSLLANDPARARAIANSRRASLSGYPTPAVANSIRRGSISASTNLPGIPPLIAPYQSTAAANSPANPFYLPWAVRGMLEEEVVKSDEALSKEVEQLVLEFEEWKPVSKVLKDVKWRLEGVRSML